MRVERWPRILSVWALLLYAGTCATQELVLRHLDEERGLPSDCVLELFVDHENLLWVGTNKGLYRYDGFDFERIGAGTALDEVNVVDIHEDVERGQMLLSAYGARLFLWHEGRVDELPVPRDRMTMVAGGNIGAFVPEGPGRLRATHTQHPITFHIDLVERTVRMEPNRKSTVAARIEEVNGVATTTCLVHQPQQVLRDSIRWGRIDTAVHVVNGEGQVVLFSPIVGHLPNGALYVCHYQTLLVLYPDGTMRRLDLAATIFGVTADERGHLWVRLGGQGVRCYDAQLRPLPLRTTELEDKQVSACVRDRQGGLWFATVDRGLYYCASPDVFTYRAHADYRAPWVSALALLDSATVVVGSGNGRVHRSTVAESPQLLAGGDVFYHTGEVKGLEVLGDTLFPGTLRVMWNLKQGRARSFPERDPRWGSFHDMQPLDARHVLLASVGGLRVVDPINNTGPEHLLTDQRCYRIVPDTEPNTWCVACQRGLYRYGPAGLHAYPVRDSLLRTSIRDLLRQGDTLWLATQHGLVCLAAGQARSIALPGPQPLPDCRALASDGKAGFWLATLDGLFHITQPGAVPVIKRYGRAQGLPSDAHYDVVRTGRWIWAISGPDVCFFDPATMRTPDPATRLRIVSVTGWAGDRVVGQGPDFIHTVDHVRLALRSANHARFTRDAFRYRLGGSGPWVPARGTVVDLLGLRPSNYTVEVQAADALGGWGPGVIVPWTIHPAWWQRTAVRAMAVLLLALLVGGGVWYYRERKQRERWLATEVQRYHHKALIAQMEPHFLFNALSGIQHFVARGDVDASTRYLAKFAKLMRGLLQAAHDEVVTVQDEATVLENYCALEALRATPTFSYSIEVDPAIDLRTTIPSFLVQPYVENAIRHGLRHLRGERTGVLRVHFTRADAHTLRCTVEDNGVGRAAAGVLVREGQAWRSMGTSINTQRFRLLGKKHGAPGAGVHTEDLVDAHGNTCGTRVTLRLPTDEPNNEQATQGSDEGGDRGR